MSRQDFDPPAQTSLDFKPTPAAGPAAGARFEMDELGVAWILFDHPVKPVNVLDSATLEALRGYLDEASRRKAIGIVFASAKPDMFLAGADVDEIAGVTEARTASEKSAYGQAVFERIARYPKPTVAVIAGPCLGGGYELALACSLRIAEDTPAVRIGLPETQLGILPGFGGTQRLPRRAGLRTALDVILAGKTLPAKPAARRGLVDLLVPAGMGRDIAIEFLAGDREIRAYRPSNTDRLLALAPPLRNRVFRAARARLAERVEKDHYPAPFHALDAIAAGYTLDETAAYRREAELLGQALATETCRSLVGLFQAGQKAKSPRGLDLSAGRRVDRLGVVGAGIMGGGIAWLAAEKDLPVRVKDIAPEPLEGALRTAAGLWKGQLERRRITPRELTRRVECLSFTLDTTGFSTVDLVVEAVVEDLAIKRRVVAELEASRRGDGLGPVIASNTSSLLIDDIATGARHPERVVGLHFFNPVHRMPLVEVVGGPRSHPEAVATAYRLALDLGKTPILVRDGAGFLVNRLLAFYLGEAIHLVERGADPTHLDDVLMEFGMPMGPIELLDQIGLDVADKVTRVLGTAFGDRLPGQASLGRLVELGHLGKKSGRGFYLYGGRDRAGVSDAAKSAAGNPAPWTPSREDMLDRLLLPMVNEAARCLEERVAQRPQDVDLGMVMGTGFPAFRGGLLRWADRRGISAVLTRLEGLAGSVGPRFAPSEALIRRSGGFYPTS